MHDIRKRLKRVVRTARPIAKKLVVHTSLPTILLSTSLLFARYLPNSDFSYPTEMTLPIVLFAVIGTAIFYLYRWVFRGRSYPAHVASFLLIYAIYGFQYAFPYVQKWTDAMLPSTLTTSFSSAALRIVLLFGIFWAVAYGIDRVLRLRQLRPVLHHIQPYKVMLFAVCFIFAMQAVQVGSRLWSIKDQWTYHPTASLPAKPAAEPADKPNVYYLLFDRYASSDTLRDVYGFDNTQMTAFFRDQGFVNREPAYANYPFTQHSISSTFSMGYLSDLEERFKGDAGKFQTAFPYRSIISDPPIAQVFKRHGYGYNQVSSWWDFSRVGVKADSDPVKSFRLRILGMTFWLTDLQRDIFYKSAFSPILQKGISIGGVALVKYDQDRNPRQNFQDQIAAVQDIARNKNAGNRTQPQFTFAHILAPHDPYLFKADGSDADYNGDRTDQDIDENIKYSNQLTYANTRIREMIGTIRQQDPGAIIVFQPDEGPYPKEFRGKLTPDNYFDPKNLNETSLKQKFGITASYYMPGIDTTEVQRELTSSVNAFPFIFNRYFGYDIGYLPECNFSVGNKYVLYDYTLQTGRLQGGDDPAECRQFDR
jgi:hypothetical protein